MPEPPSILSTKRLGEGVRQQIRSLGWTLREEDFIETTGLAVGQVNTITASTVASESTAVIFTSAKGVEYLPYGRPESGLHPGHWLIACLSGKTREAVLVRFSQEQIICTAKNAKELAVAIIADGRFSDAVFFCALDHRPELPLALRQAGIPVMEIPVYKTVGQPKNIDTPYDGVLFFSPSGVESFFQLNHLPKGVICFAIGGTTAETIKDYTDERIIVSDDPTQEDLLRCVQFYYDNQQCYE